MAFELMKKGNDRTKSIYRKRPYHLSTCFVFLPIELKSMKAACGPPNESKMQNVVDVKFILSCGFVFHSLHSLRNF